MKLTEICSRSPIFCLAIRESKPCKISDGIATTKPSSVVTSASEIPEDKLLASPVPKIVIKVNVLIIPVTVPKRPSRGAAAAVNAMKGKNRSNVGCVERIFSKRISSKFVLLIL